MDRQKGDLKSSVRYLVDGEQESFEAHPAPGVLAAYHAGDLSAQATEELRDHLSLCRECADLVRDLAAFPQLEPPSGEESLTERHTAAEWRALRSRLDFAAPVAERPRPSGRRSSRGAAVPYLLAASFFLATLGLSGWVLNLRNEIERLSQPQLNAHLSDLIDVGDPFRQGGAPERIRVPPEADQIVLILNLSRPQTFPDYRVEILESLADDAAVLWSSRGLRRGREGNFTLTLRRDFLRPGSYRLRLFGLEGGRQQPLATFVVEIADAGNGGQDR